MKKVKNLDLDDGDEDSRPQELEHPWKHSVPWQIDLGKSDIEAK